MEKSLQKDNCRADSRRNKNMSSCHDSTEDEDSIPPPEYEEIKKSDDAFESGELFNESYELKAVEDNDRSQALIKNSQQNVTTKDLAPRSTSRATTNSEKNASSLMEEGSTEISYDEADDTDDDDDEDDGENDGDDNDEELDSEITHITADSDIQPSKSTNSVANNETYNSVSKNRNSTNKNYVYIFENGKVTMPFPSKAVNETNQLDSDKLSIIDSSITKQEETRSTTPSGKGSREFLALQKSFTQSKVLSNFVTETDRSRKSRKVPLKSDDSKPNGDHEKFRICRARSKSCTKSVVRTLTSLNNSAPQRWPSDEKLSKRENMRSQNTEFVQKQMKFLSRVNHEQAVDEPMSDVSDGEQSLNESNKTTGSCEIKDNCWQPPPKKGSDSYCWKCRKCGDLIACSKCPRSFHPKCIKISTNLLLFDKSWICPECINLENCINGSKKSKKENLSADLLNQLLLFALKRMKEVKGHERFLDVPDPTECPAYRMYIVNPVTLNSIQEKIERKEFRCTEEFVLENKWIQHNVSTAYSVYNNKDIIVSKALLKVCKQEATEIETCSECYLNANTRKDWFLDVCVKPHILLWAKLKGFPYWPAKGMGLGPNSLLNVRFFGDHDRAFVPVKDCYLYSEIDPNPYTGKRTFRSGIADCIKEISAHIENIRTVVGAFNYAQPRTPYDPCNEMKQLEEMMPGVFEYMKKQQAIQKPPLTLRIVKTAGNSLSIVMKTDSGTDSDHSNQGLERKRKFFNESNDIKTHKEKEERKSNDELPTTSAKPLSPLKPTIISKSIIPKTYANKSNYEVIAKPQNKDETNSTKISSVILKRKSDVVYQSPNIKKSKSSEDGPIKNEYTSSPQTQNPKIEEKMDDLNTKSVKRKRISRSTELDSKVSATVSEKQESQKTQQTQQEQELQPAKLQLQESQKQIQIQDGLLEKSQREKEQLQKELLERKEQEQKQHKLEHQQKLQKLQQELLLQQRHLLEQQQKQLQQQIEMQEQREQERLQQAKQHKQQLQQKQQQRQQQQHQQLQKSQQQQQLQQQQQKLQQQHQKSQNQTQQHKSPNQKSQQQQPTQQQPQKNSEENLQKNNKESYDSTANSMTKLVQNRQGVTIKKIGKNQNEPTQATDVNGPAQLNVTSRHQQQQQQKQTTTLNSTKISPSPPKPIQIISSSTSSSSLSSKSPKYTSSKPETLERFVTPKGLIPFEDIKVENCDDDIITSKTKAVTDKAIETASTPSKSTSTSPIPTLSSSSSTPSTIGKPSQPSTDPLSMNINTDLVKNEVFSDDECPKNTISAETSPGQSIVTVVNQHSAATNLNNAKVMDAPRIVGETMIKRIVVRSLESLTMQPPQIKVSSVSVNSVSTPSTTTVNVNTSLVSATTVAPNSKSQQTARARKSFPNKVSIQNSTILPSQDSRHTLTKNSMVYIPVENQKNPIPIKTAVSKTFSQPLTKITCVTTAIPINTAQSQIVVSVNSSTTTTTTTPTLLSPVVTPIPSFSVSSNPNKTITTNPIIETATATATSTSTIVTNSINYRPNYALTQTNMQLSTPTSQNPTQLEITTQNDEMDKHQREAEGHILSGIVTPSLAAAITDTIVCGPPKLTHKPKGALRSNGNYGFNSDAGPVCRILAEGAHKITDFFISVMQDTVSDMANADILPAKIVELQIELETKTAEYEKRLFELKQNTDTMLCEMKKSMEAERLRIIAETRKQCEIERIHAVEQTKKKQWCTNCGREANSYCCWNTSYCDANCQSIDWNRHKPNCCQVNPHLNNNTETQGSGQGPGPGVLYTSPAALTVGNANGNLNATSPSIQAISSTPGFMPNQSPVHLYQTAHSISTAQSSQTSNTTPTTVTTKKIGTNSHSSSTTSPSATFDLAYKSQEVLKLPPSTYLRAIKPNIRMPSPPVHRFHIPLPINTPTTIARTPFTFVNNEGNWQVYGVPATSNVNVTQTFQHPSQCLVSPVTAANPPPESRPLNSVTVRQNPL